jgi:hypothetical protein
VSDVAGLGSRRAVAAFGHFLRPDGQGLTAHPGFVLDINQHSAVISLLSLQFLPWHAVCPLGQARPRARQRDKEPKMATANTSHHCLHCYATVSHREILDGWCDSCGKKIPLSLQGEVKRDGTTPPRPDDSYDEPAARKRRGQIWLAVAGMVLSVVGLIVAFSLLLGSS